MEKHYFIGEGPEAEKLIAEVVSRREETLTARRALMRDFGSDGLILGGVWGYNIVGLAFKEKTDLNFLKGGNRVTDGYAYYPKRNTKKGKELAQRLNKESLHFSVSYFILSTLKLHRSVFSARRMYVSASCITEDLKRILIYIPGPKEKEDGPSDDFPAIPEWMREVKESEWLAAQGR